VKNNRTPETLSPRSDGVVSSCEKIETTDVGQTFSLRLASANLPCAASPSASARGRLVKQTPDVSRSIF
jgi:hypothetical protein